MTSNFLKYHALTAGEVHQTSAVYHCSNTLLRPPPNKITPYTPQLILESILVEIRNSGVRERDCLPLASLFPINHQPDTNTPTTLLSHRLLTSTGYRTSLHPAPRLRHSYRTPWSYRRISRQRGQCFRICLPKTCRCRYRGASCLGELEPSPPARCQR